MSRWPLGVFASIDAGFGVHLSVAHELGVPTIQLHAPHAASRRPQSAHEFLARVTELGMKITVVFGGFEGESYADIPTVKRTVGLVPPETRAARVKEMKEIADFARLLGVDAVGLHIGFVPHDASDAIYGQVIAVARDLCNHCRAQDQRVHLETGQESADTLLKFLAVTGCDNLFVNFDPANMVLYGSGDPIDALKKVGRYVRSVHCKDGKWAAHPGEEWGAEVPLGQGDVGMERFLRTLKEIGYDGPLTIEREIPQDPVRQKEEIGSGMRLLEELKAKIL
ncbi:MAG: sugar phosphate isomerase/epimerase family protein [Thermoguttaceae bacterium]|jgi:sugar phosphate isomerase/epimerase